MHVIPLSFNLVLVHCYVFQLISEQLTSTEKSNATIMYLYVVNLIYTIENVNNPRTTMFDE